jgi:hypothetical protein
MTQVDHLSLSALSADYEGDRPEPRCWPEPAPGVWDGYIFRPAQAQRDDPDAEEPPSEDCEILDASPIDKAAMVFVWGLLGIVAWAAAFAAWPHVAPHLAHLRGGLASWMQ